MLENVEDMVLDFFKQVDLSKVKKKFPQNSIFLCGGTGKGTIREDVNEALKKRGLHTVLAEEVITSEKPNDFKYDLLQLEKYIANLVSVIPLICESFGSACELGAFVNDKAIRGKLLIILKEEYFHAKSFIRVGTIQHFLDLDRDNQNRICAIDDKNPLNDLQIICDQIEKFSKTGKTIICDFDESYFQIILLLDLILILAVAEHNSLFIIMQKILINNSIKPPENDEYQKQFDSMIYVLETLNLIKLRHKGFNRYYISKFDIYRLEYRYYHKVKNSIVDIRKKVLSLLYDSDARVKINILNDERKGNDIEWLQESSIIENHEQYNKTITTAPFQYKTFLIKKRNGGKREVSQPTQAVKDLQRCYVEDLREYLHIHDSAVAYRKSINGIVKNATLHKNNKYFYKFDFKNFFPSIKACHLNLFLEKKTSFDEKKRADILRVCCKFNKATKEGTHTAYSILKNKSINEILNFMLANDFSLSIGAPSSPFISNVILYDFDEVINLWASKNGFVYSRYADDITFSCKEKKDIKDIENKINITLNDIDYLDIVINQDKTNFLSFGKRVHITGLNITPQNKVSLGRNMKKKIRAMAYQYMNNTLEKDKISVFRGWLSYAKQVERQFYDKIISTYKLEKLFSDKVV